MYVCEDENECRCVYKRDYIVWDIHIEKGLLFYYVGSSVNIGSGGVYSGLE